MDALLKINQRPHTFIFMTTFYFIKKSAATECTVTADEIKLLEQMV